MGHRGLIFGLWVAATLVGQDVAPGKILDKVECRSNAQQSYSLYLPSSYSKARRYHHQLVCPKCTKSSGKLRGQSSRSLPRNAVHGTMQI
jgi:hypothetical protein